MMTGHRQKKALLALLLLFCGTLCAGAADYDVMQWSERGLKWSDFQGESVLGGTTSYLKADLELTARQKTVKGNTSINLGTEAKMYRSQSFGGDTTLQTKQRLRYHQLQFDLLEVMRRRLQNDLNSGMNGIDADSRLKYYRNLYNEQILAVDDETKNGTDDHKLQEWEYFTRKNLEEIGLPAAPTVEPSDFSYGLFIGIGGLFPTSTIKDYFGGCFTFTAGLTGGYQRLKLKALIEYGQPKFNEPNVFGLTEFGHPERYTQSSVNTYASFLGISASLGYSIVDTKRFAVTPHVGMYWGNYGWNVANYKWEPKEDNPSVYEPIATDTEKKTLKNFNWMAGIDFDIKIHSYVTNTPFLFGRREQLTSMVRITPYIAHGVYSKTSPDLQGYQIGFTVSYVGIARALKLK